MTEIFLSYAREDGILGQRIAGALRARGFVVYWWQDPARRWERFLEEIPQAIFRADRFLILLSHHFLASPWCRRELNQAIHLESQGRRPFITVLEPEGEEQEWPGWLAEYARSRVSMDTVDRVVDEYQEWLVQQAPPVDAPSGWPRQPMPKFRNRVDELDQIGDELTSRGGADVWYVSAPPQLGKSWFVIELAARVVKRAPNCTVRLVDLKDHPSGLRSSPTRLLAKLFGLPDDLTDWSTTSAESVLAATATKLSRGQPQQMYILDSADLLESVARDELPRSMATVVDLLRQRRTDVRLQVVFCGRHVDRWRPIRSMRYHKRPLTEFSLDIISGALADVVKPDHGISERQLPAVAERLHRLSEGLPALLVPMLELILRDVAVLDRDDDWWEREVVWPYVRNQLLSVDSLYPAGGRELGASRQVLEAGLRELVTYRLITGSHLQFHGLSELYDELRDTALFTEALGDPWDVISPPIRRLLYRFFLPLPEERLAAEQQALVYYQSWRNKPAGEEQCVMLVECIWHEVMRRTADGTVGQPGLVAYAGSTAREFFDGLRNSQYSAAQLARYVVRLFDSDNELQTALAPYPGTFDAVLQGVLDVIGGMPR